MSSSSSAPGRGPVDMTEGMLRVSGLHHRFGVVEALRGIDLEIPAGQFTTLLGPSGSGKSTLLRIIAGFEHPAAGSVQLDGVDLLSTPPERRPVNMVFQQYALFPHRDVWGNVAFGLELAGVGRAEMANRVGRAIDVVQLSGYERRDVDALSGGEQQRVALARAIINRPRVLLLDEPLGALDLQLRRSMQLELRELHRLISGTFIYVTHDQDEALTMSDQIVVMREGRIEQVGGPEEIYRRPSSRFVAQFIGETNLLDGVAEAGTVRIGGGGPHATVTDLPDGPVSVSVRPEDLKVISPGAPDVRAGIEGTIEDVIFLGAVVRYHVAVDGRPPLSVEEHSGSAQSRRAGDRVLVGWEPEMATVLAS